MKWRTGTPVRDLHGYASRVPSADQAIWAVGQQPSLFSISME